MGAATPAGKDPANLRNADMLTAVAGKLLPYTVMFSVIGILANYVLFGLMNIPFQGSLWLMNIVTILFIMATQALAVLIFSIFPKIAYIISVVSMVCSFGSYTVGSDISGNSNVCTGACGVLPVSGTALHRSGTGYDLFRCGVCLFLAIGGCTTGIPAAGHTDSAFIEVVDTEDEGKRRNSPYRRQSIVRHCSNRYTVRYIIRYIARHRSIPEQCHPHDGKPATNPAILLVLTGGIFLYGLLYNYMYAPNLVRKAPVAVVDLSHSALSREYVRWLDAAPQTSVYAQTPDILEAREWMKKGEVTGILYIPSDFETRVARGETSVFTLYAATDAFLNFKGLQEASSRVMLARKRCPPACRNSIPAAARSVGRCVVRSRQRIGNGPLQLHRRIRFLPDSRRNDCHHLPDNADGDCHAYR